MIGDQDGVEFGEMAEEAVAGCPAAPFHGEGLMPPARAHESVRTTEAAELAAKRFELRVTASQLARWRTIASDQGVSAADLVRFAVDELAAALPAGHIAAEKRRAFDALVQALRPSLVTRP